MLCIYIYTNIKYLPCATCFPISNILQHVFQYQISYIYALLILQTKHFSNYTNTKYFQIYNNINIYNIYICCFWNIQYVHWWLFVNNHTTPFTHTHIYIYIQCVDIYIHYIIHHKQITHHKYIRDHGAMPLHWGFLTFLSSASRSSWLWGLKWSHRHPRREPWFTTWTVNHWEIHSAQWAVERHTS